ncbi:hypothetical protein [Halobacillus hunanensis]|uniref:hypothetical protein n=1 Tax=Halobacillus hunanensis TaxID=578214 RepID=UPI0009A690C4|nr:hypothetical protein [Halobacillus hunanensis]
MEFADEFYNSTDVEKKESYLKENVHKNVRDLFLPNELTDITYFQKAPAKGEIAFDIGAQRRSKELNYEYDEEVEGGK